VALGSTQPLTEMSTGNIPGSNGRPARKAVNLTAICEPQHLTTLWASTACYRDTFTLYLYINFILMSLLCLWELLTYERNVCLMCRYTVPRTSLCLNTLRSQLVSLRTLGSITKPLQYVIDWGQYILYCTGLPTAHNETNYRHWIPNQWSIQMLLLVA
jgi:hypothetical protein